MINSTLTLDQLQSLKEEFVDHKIEEMSREEMADWIRTVYMKEMDYATFEDVKKIHPDFPFDQQTLRSCGMDYSHPDLPPMFKGQQNTHPKYKNDC